MVAVTGAGGSLGRRVVAALSPFARVLEVDPRAPDLKRLLEGVDTVVHLSFAAGASLDDGECAVRNAESAARVFDAAGAAAVDQLVVMSSAAVYGAWPNNPVPLTEDAPVRPNPGFGFAVQKAEVERLAGEWLDAHPGTVLTVLRPAVQLDEEQAEFLSAVLGVRAAIATGDPDVPVQFVHVDDLAAAVAHVVSRRLDGVFNVAADGWVSAGQARALAGTTPRVRLPERVQRLLARLGRRPSGATPYTLHPWVVAIDRIKATGWTPQQSNEEAIVATTEGMPWSRLSPQRRQELALAGAALVLAGGAVASVAIVRRVRRRRAGR